ncbi:uncharacterized protein ACLA_060220 [Aspergillus clavatus NRRL 1]|uniref:Uncharacterized protein n=1 Tax=Aspergillus clavatus (strain ATCC 1007 / CBS 513.65 / DSM 816 / NCTC 3887 / NRRL 1 / QM 1276 / 107) TaxID=344612 RepID=A1C4L4_ASPCL|nr:uncharacterized protein ACLA_060220 [Aspergillus clavatus NRRL 1]EAW15354.1 conserved hypothetical protein [Aspergillus clavatus NRRL 1]
MDTVNKITGGETHTEEQKRHFYDNLTDDQRKQQSYTEWVKEAYNDQYEKWMPWLEEQYLKWFGKGDNKASYVTKDTLAKTKATGVRQLDQAQDDVHNFVGNQLGENGVLAPVGNLVSKEGINRAERNGKDEDGSYGGPLGGVTDPMVDRAKGAGQTLSSGAQTVGNSISGGVQSAGSWLQGSSSKEPQS